MKINGELLPMRIHRGELCSEIWSWGTYYIKEIRPSEGYMFDEAVYDVTISYKDQMIKIEKRDETASEARNELTVDDESTSHTIYSGDYVVKQGIEFIKTSDNTYQTELEVMEGAGFFCLSHQRSVRC